MRFALPLQKGEVGRTGGTGPQGSGFLRAGSAEEVGPQWGPEARPTGSAPLVALHAAHAIGTHGLLLFRPDNQRTTS